MVNDNIMSIYCLPFPVSPFNHHLLLCIFILMYIPSCFSEPWALMLCTAVDLAPVPMLRWRGGRYVSLQSTRRTGANVPFFWRFWPPVLWIALGQDNIVFRSRGDHDTDAGSLPARVFFCFFCQIQMVPPSAL